MKRISSEKILAISVANDNEDIPVLIADAQLASCEKEHKEALEKARIEERVEEIFKDIDFWDKNYAFNDWGNARFREHILALKKKNNVV